MQGAETARRIDFARRRLRPSANQAHRLGARLPVVSLRIAVNCPATTIRAIGPPFSRNPMVVAVIQHSSPYRNPDGAAYYWTRSDSVSDVDRPATLLRAIAGARSVGLSVVP